MSQIAAIYVLPGSEAGGEQAAHALARITPEVRRVVVVTDPHGLEIARERFEGRSVRVVAMAGDGPISVLGGYRKGLKHLMGGAADDPEPPQIAVMTGTHAFCPIDDRPGWLSERVEGLSGAWSHCWIDPALDPHLAPMPELRRLPTEHFLAFGPTAIAAGLADLWDELSPTGDRRTDIETCTAPLFSALAKRGVPISFDLPEEAYETCEPELFECSRVVREGRLLLPRALLELDPLLHDANATDVRGALETLREFNSELYGFAMHHALATLPSRDFCTIANQYEVLPDHAVHPGKHAWSFGTVAVFIHAFYPEMMDEFWERIDLLPCDAHLFISTSREEHASVIRAYLDAKNWPGARADIRVVAQNRGRDMSSLFITFRDVVLSDRFEVALRLHSKRTPQVSYQVGESFKAHLLDNLVCSSGYVSNLLDTLEAEPDIGLVIPPIIHVGFGTLGHSWFNNRKPLQRLAKRMKIDVQLDPHTPVTAYGTMFWFRTAALRRMFEWPWSWEDYNPEPHHIDGGLAHVQERLIGVCAQDAGFRTLTVMNPHAAARGYAKLEYKHQTLAAYLSGRDADAQIQEIRELAMSGRRRIVFTARSVYGKVIVRYPRSRRYIKPLIPTILRILGVKANRIDQPSR
ncbi:MAG: rhamnan synthesis F family protein [Pseudomonadota bacterium]